jgi:hypothetical protein
MATLMPPPVNLSAKCFPAILALESMIDCGHVDMHVTFESLLGCKLPFTMLTWKHKCFKDITIGLLFRSGDFDKRYHFGRVFRSVF